MSKILSQNIKSLRRRKNMSQDELARELSVSRNKIASYEGKNIEPRLSLLLQMSNFFNVTVDDLINSDLTDEEILSKALKRAISIYSMEARSFKNKGSGLGFDKLINPDVLAEYVENNSKIARMAKGFAEYYALRDKQQMTPAENMEHVNAKIVLSVLDHLLSVNKMLIDRIK